MNKKITSYFIDDKNKLHTYIKDKKHVTISNVKNDKEAQIIINQLNKENK